MPLWFSMEKVPRRGPAWLPVPLTRQGLTALFLLEIQRGRISPARNNLANLTVSEQALVSRTCA